MTDNSAVVDADKETLEKLQAIIDNYERERLTDKDIEIIHKMIELWKAFEVMGRVAGFARNVAIWVAAFIILWFAPMENIVKAIKKWVGLE